MAMVMISVALLALLMSIISSMTLIEANRQESLVMAAARQKISELQSYGQYSQGNFTTMFGTYSDTANNKHTFGLTGLGAAGSGYILFPTTPAMVDSNFVANAGPFALDESITDPKLGMPFDLNQNGSIDGDAKSNYKLLPVKIIVRWETIHGWRTSEFNIVLNCWSYW
jgi:type II secretory pathway pseudopilin PulG